MLGAPTREESGDAPHFNGGHLTANNLKRNAIAYLIWPVTVYPTLVFPPVLRPEHVLIRPLHLNHNPMVTTTVRRRAPTSASLSRLGHEQRTVTVTRITDLHDAVADAHAVVVVVVGAGNVGDGLRYAVLAVGARAAVAAVAVGLGRRPVGQGVGQPARARVARHDRGRH